VSVSNCYISQGSVATYLRCGGNYYTQFVGNFFLFTAVQEFLKSVKIWHSYRQSSRPQFFLGTQCRHRMFAVIDFKNQKALDCDSGPAPLPLTITHPTIYNITRKFVDQATKRADQPREYVMQHTVESNFDWMPSSQNCEEQHPVAPSTTNVSDTRNHTSGYKCITLTIKPPIAAPLTSCAARWPP